MKTQKILFVLLLTFAFTACHNNDDVKPKNDKITKDDFQKITDFEGNLGFAQSFVFENIFIDGNSGGRSSIRESVMHLIQENVPCAELPEPEDNTLSTTIDFGDGCEKDDGTKLFGKVQITFNFYKDSITFSTKYINYKEIPADGEASPLANGDCKGKLTFPPPFLFLVKSLHEDFTLDYGNGTTGSFKFSDELDPLDNGVKFVEFLSEGVLPNGDTFKSGLVTPLIMDYGCDKSDYPVKGIQSLTFNGVNAKIDYGNGNCDNDFTIINE
jgi:hypothetical protein